MPKRALDPETNSPDEAETGEDTSAGFAGLGLDPSLVRALTALGYEEPTPIQTEAIPALIAGKDVLGQAATGTGKTAAFSLPILQRLHEAGGKHGAGPYALILAPTRELAMQVAEAIHKYGKAMGVSVLPVYGGAAMAQQLKALKRGVDIVVATPGRALDHIRRRSLVLGGVRTVVLDEADEMLDMGFAEDLEAILSETPADRQTALFSATIAPRIAAIANKHLKNPVRVTIAREKTKAGDVPRVRQVAYIVPRAHKMATLGRVLDMESPKSALVFCRTRTEVDQLTETLNSRGYRCEALHGGMTQDQRDRVMKKFRANTADLLVATDVAARGLDIGHLSHVFNYDVPTSPDAYVHRIGRTGRAGREGVAITLAEPREHRFLKNIENITRQKIEIASIPTVADMRVRRMELTRATLQEILIGGEMDEYRRVVEVLADGDYDVMDVAAAAVKMAHEASGNDKNEAEEEIPVTRTPTDRSGSSHDRPKREGKPPRTVAGTKRKPAWEVAKIYIGAGRKAKIRPGDIVGAIANELQIDADSIGAIEIFDRFSLVEVPDEIADDIVTTLRATHIKGKRVPVRRDKELA
ncbi:MAG: DEAD/DEAH box helicase [Gemmatimonadota bacterium]|nr:DEAD/DEAH box helicase [Gemmatimonadota bacterium]